MLAAGGFDIDSGVIAEAWDRDGVRGRVFVVGRRCCRLPIRFEPTSIFELLRALFGTALNGLTCWMFIVTATGDTQATDVWVDIIPWFFGPLCFV